MSIRPASLTTPAQATLPWPGADERCPKCRGAGDVHYLHAHQPWVGVLGGKRIICPVWRRCWQRAGARREWTAQEPAPTTRRLRQFHAIPGP